MKAVKLEEYIKTCGSAEAAAGKIGVSLQTVRRWRVGKHPTSRLTLNRLSELGIRLA